MVIFNIDYVCSMYYVNIILIFFINNVIKKKNTRYFRTVIIPHYSLVFTCKFGSGITLNNI